VSDRLPKFETPSVNDADEEMEISTHKVGSAKK
jgi:hypothetical protein